MLCEPKGVVSTKRWVVELLLDLAGYCSDKNLRGHIVTFLGSLKVDS